MNQTYEKEQVLKTGAELVEFLVDICNTANNISGFLKDYIALLSSENGIYHRQQVALDTYAAMSTRTQEEADRMMQTSQENSQSLQGICSEFQQLNERISGAQEKRERHFALSQME